MSRRENLVAVGSDAEPTQGTAAEQAAAEETLVLDEPIEPIEVRRQRLAVRPPDAELARRAARDDQPTVVPRRMVTGAQEAQVP